MPPEDQDEKLGTDVLNGEPFRLQTVEASCNILNFYQIVGFFSKLHVSNQDKPFS